ncbi:UDP:flavonoid glycosyltransferase YjiC (YdhE family) [Asanoa ferruginea]|uniref:UDP:flavonoid glycosyltransferase YjiC (YdhE family) n=1 Tax=Asanoa ferruginea TaxID=53367 RepID=A0A3D9Z9T5_9ACTN|nr:glycosyltransferase [Asanoa ferruginea]REF94166.1 UDP:flavonoid glycosyltransferase YjiC (YdhE family) [Asanoa ferruginea]GIF49889.1 glycosyl transferase [Asanoa ferruginea]
MHALFVTVDGGGNLPPALGIAREIVRRGGTARFLGHEPQRRAIEAAGFAFEPVREGLPYEAAAPRSTLSGLRDLTAVFADAGIGADALRLAAAAPTDIVVVDCLLLGAMRTLIEAGIPTVSLVHTLWSYFAGQARGPVGAILRLRGIRMRQVLESPALSLVTTRPEFEPPAASFPARVRHVGVVWQDPPAPPPPRADPPRVLVSLSTTRFPGQERALRSIVDGLADLPAEVVVTTGPAVDPAILRKPANTTIHRYADHSALMPGAALVIGHGGHATTARALSHGVPLLVMPMHPLMDQPAIGAAVTRLGVGRSISKTARPAEIRAAVVALLDSAAHRAAAIRLGAEIREHDGAVRAVDLIETDVHPRPAPAQRRELFPDQGRPI